MLCTKKRIRISGIILLLIFSAKAAYPQSDNLTEDYIYAREFIWGINKNNRDGLIGGFVFRYSWALADNWYQHGGLEIVNVKHPQEKKGILVQRGSPVIVDKINYLYNFRLHYGREKILFKKAPSQGVQISWINAVGPSIGLIAPYYIEYVDKGVLKREQFNPNKHDYSIITGTGYLFQGVGKSDATIGIHLKTSLSLEFGFTKRDVAGLEFGFMLEAFANEVPLLIENSYENSNIFTYFFVNMFYGSRK